MITDEMLVVGTKALKRLRRVLPMSLDLPKAEAVIEAVYPLIAAQVIEECAQELVRRAAHCYDIEAVRTEVPKRLGIGGGESGE